MKSRHLRVRALGTVGAGVASLASVACTVAPDRTPAPSPAVISHVVLVTLSPEHRTEATVARMRADAQRELATIPGVVSYGAGPHLDTGRPTVTGGYDLGLYIGFDTEGGYASYVTHPDHVAFVERWRPRIESLVVYDFVDRP